MYNEIKNTNNKQTWPSKVKDVICKAGFGNFWISQVDTLNFRKFLRDIKQRLIDIEYQCWQSEIFCDQRSHSSQSNKLRTYRTFKIKYEYEEYLDKVKNPKQRTLFTKLRISNHKLEIERRRYQRPYIKPEDRLCQLCGSEKEDEKHFLLRCAAYDNLRKEFLIQMKRESHFDGSKLSEHDLFLKLICPKGEAITKTVKLVADMLDIRSSMVF